MRKYSGWIVMGIVLIMIFAASCSKTGKKADVTVSVEASPSTFNWHRTIYASEKNIYYLSMEGLTRSDVKGRVEPGIASDWQVLENGKLWRFKLRDTKWWDGSQITASQFVDGIKYSLNPKLPKAFYSYLLYYIDGAQEYNLNGGSWSDVKVKALDDRTLEIRLKNPTDYFDYLASLPIYAPIRMDKVQEWGENYGKTPDYTIYNGPFTIESVTDNGDVHFVKNKNYWNASKILLESVDTKLIKSANESFGLFMKGEVDVSIYLSDEQKNKIIASKNGTINRFADGTVWSIAFNCNNKVLKNKNIRKALSYAIDRKYIVDKVAIQPWKPAMAIIPPNSMGGVDPNEDFRNKFPSYFDDNNVELAKKMLNEGMGELQITKFPKMTILVNNEINNIDYMREVKRMWKDNLGIDVEIKALEYEEKAKVQNSGDYEMSFVGWGMDFPSPLSVLDAFSSASNANVMRYYNLAYDEVISRSKKVEDRAEKYALMYKAEKIIMEDMPLAPIYFRFVDYAINPKLKGYSKGVYSPSLNLINAKMDK